MDWIGIAALVIVSLAIAGIILSRLPITTSMVYLADGVMIAPMGTELLAIDTVASPELLHRLAEGAVIISLLTTGLKLCLEWLDPR